MEPVTTSILVAIIAGATAGATDTVKRAIGDTYDKLKDLLKKKLGEHSDVMDAVEKLEKQPDRDDRKATVQKELEVARAGDDAEIVRVAQAVLDRLQALPAATQDHIQSAVGNFIAQAGRGGTATVNVRDNPSRK